MSWLIAQIKYRSKAVVIAVVTVALTALVTFLTASGTEAHIVSLIPAQYQGIGTLVVGAIITAVVHAVPLGAKPATASDTPPVTELADTPATSMIPTVDPTAGH